MFGHERLRRGRVDGHNRLILNCFSESMVYPKRYFHRQFRRGTELFKYMSRWSCMPPSLSKGGIPLHILDIAHSRRWPLHYAWCIGNAGVWWETSHQVSSALLLLWLRCLVWSTWELPMFKTWLDFWRSQHRMCFSRHFCLHWLHALEVEELSCGMRLIVQRIEDGLYHHSWSRGRPGDVDLDCNFWGSGGINLAWFGLRHTSKISNFTIYMCWHARKLQLQYCCAHGYLGWPYLTKIAASATGTRGGVLFHIICWST
jgi:hypothetical protein